MVILKVEVDDFVVLYPKGHSPVTGNLQAPRALSVASQNVRFPHGKGAQLLGFLHRIEERKNLSELVHGVRAQAPRGVRLVQATQTFVRNTPRFLTQMYARFWGGLADPGVGLTAGISQKQPGFRGFCS